MTADDLMIYFGPSVIREFINHAQELPAGSHQHALAAETFGCKGLDVLAHIEELLNLLNKITVPIAANLTRNGKKCLK